MRNFVIFFFEHFTLIKGLPILLIKTKVDDETIKRASIGKKALKSFLNKVLKEKGINNPMLDKKM